MLLLPLLACAPPFDQTRKDLQDFRLVGAAARGAELRTLIWSGEGAFHSVAPTVEWTIDGAVVTEAPAPPFTAEVRVESAAGDVETGRLVVEADGVVPTITGFERTPTADGAEVAVVAEGGITRWKGSSGTFVESGPTSATWTAGDDATAALVGLTLDSRGGVDWAWIDVAADDSPALAVGGRLLPVDATVPTAGTYDATLTPADTLAGVILSDLTPASADDTVEIVCGLDPFDADALADGRCGLDEAAGARVRLTGAPWP